MIRFQTNSLKHTSMKTYILNTRENNSIVQTEKGSRPDSFSFLHYRRPSTRLNIGHISTKGEIVPVLN